MKLSLCFDVDASIVSGELRFTTYKDNSNKTLEGRRNIGDKSWSNCTCTNLPVDIYNECLISYEFIKMHCLMSYEFIDTYYSYDISVLYYYITIIICTWLIYIYSNSPFLYGCRYIKIHIFICNYFHHYFHHIYSNINDICWQLFI